MSELEEGRLWEIAKECLTVKQYEVLFLHTGRGMSQRQIALAIGISRQAVADRIWNAHRKLALAYRKELDAVDPAGRKARRARPS